MWSVTFCCCFFLSSCVLFSVCVIVWMPVFNEKYNSGAIFMWKSMTHWFTWCCAECALGKFGLGCKQTCRNCLNNDCDPETGECRSGCRQGYSGFFCTDRKCLLCRSCIILCFHEILCIVRLISMKPISWILYTYKCVYEGMWKYTYLLAQWQVETLLGKENSWSPCLSCEW